MIHASIRTHKRQFFWFQNLFSGEAGHPPLFHNSPPRGDGECMESAEDALISLDARRGRASQERRRRHPGLAHHHLLLLPPFPAYLPRTPYHVVPTAVSHAHPGPLPISHPSARPPCMVPPSAFTDHALMQFSVVTRTRPSRPGPRRFPRLYHGIPQAPEPYPDPHFAVRQVMDPAPLHSRVVSRCQRTQEK